MTEKGKAVIFEFINMTGGFHKELRPAWRLLAKGEIKSASREALIALEDIVRKKSRLDRSVGVNLMSQAFSFDFDEKKCMVTRHPRIKINFLKTQSERNEQLGVMHYAMGLMLGPRNVLMHSSVEPFNGFLMATLASVNYLISCLVMRRSFHGNRPSEVRHKLLSTQQAEVLRIPDTA